MIHEVARHPLRDGSMAVIDRAFNAFTRRHSYEVAIVRDGHIEDIRAVTPDKGKAKEEFDTLVAMWGGK